MDYHQSITDKFFEIQSKPEIFFAKFLESAKTNTSRTRISKGILYNIRPYQAQIAGFKPGKEIKSIPKNTNNIHIYYLDHNDRVLLIEIYGQFENIINREFYFYKKNTIESVYFDNSERIRNITSSSIRSGKFIQDINVGRYGTSFYTYKYDNNLISLISVNQKEHDQNESSNFEILFYYSGEEPNKIINSFPNGYQEQIFP
ncbi:hypothetical protein [Pseudomonas fluorescens]